MVLFGAYSLFMNVDSTRLNAKKRTSIFSLTDLAMTASKRPNVSLNVLLSSRSLNNSDLGV